MPLYATSRILRTTVVKAVTRENCSPASASGLCHVTRDYHDECFGFRKAREFVFPDYTPRQLQNRTENAPLLRYVDSMRTHGHRAARIDPLDLLQREEVAALDPSRYGLIDPSKRYNVDGIIWTKPVDSLAATVHDSESFDASKNRSGIWWTLSEIAQHLQSVYVGRIAYEYMHSPSKTERLWFSHFLESQSHVPGLARTFSLGEKRRIHALLTRSEVFDNFLQLKFPNLKRYGLEGGESMLPAIDTLFRIAARAGIQHIVLAMPHRGRLNLLTDVLQYSPTALFHKIKGGSEIPEELGADGDVISHLVTSPQLLYDGVDHPLKVSLLPNPSHLEAVNSVALGKTRAKHFSLLSTSPEDCKLGDKVMCLQLHGDASFTGQGVVMEGLGLSNLPHFTSGGCVHIVVNNSIGYTTPASSARSSLYCSDIGKMINAPVLHVNGDHPEDVLRVVEVAFAYRHYFRKDVIIDLLVYRRWGHNELDEPSFTQPLMYKKIRSRRSVPQSYEDKLLAENVLTPEEAAGVRTKYKAHLEDQLSKVDSFTPTASMLKEQWGSMVWPADEAAVRNPDTGVEKAVLEKVGRASIAIPDGFEIHPRLQRHIKHRLQSVDSGQGIDWATAEAMAFGSLMLEGCDVRISGQDVGRGTFSHRHAMLVDQNTERVVVPLNTVLDCPGKLELANSSLSEMAVLGFEYGASWERPSLLTVWEAQFGDFFNGAQVIIDTFIASAESKWLKQNGIVLLLPHGLDGAGPEHSSCRIERMLQLSDDPYIFDAREPFGNVNMHVVFPTTPAQYFHLLRRQIRRNYRKPLVVVAPKGMLRLPASSSSIPEFEPGTKFQPVINDPHENEATAERVVLLTGKIYYDLIKERQTRALQDQVGLIRIEELSPFPFSELRRVLTRYNRAKEFVWLQEEARNQGAYTHVSNRIESVLSDMGREVPRLMYKGRKESALPATGIGKKYVAQQRAINAAAFEGL